MNSKHAFTLIELLIVVAIISILAAIGASNYLEAQTRGKTARVKSDMRTLAGAIESYHVDNGAYPISAIGDMLLDHPLNVLTTPMAYVTSTPRDAFGVGVYDFNPGISLLGYEYRDRATTSKNVPAETYGHIWRDVERMDYFLHSCGPNRIWNVMPFIMYDPTNGTISPGDIVRMGPMGTQ